MRPRGNYPSLGSQMELWTQDMVPDLQDLARSHRTPLPLGAGPWWKGSYTVSPLSPQKTSPRTAPPTWEEEGAEKDLGLQCQPKAAQAED
jgi:hypothetical protein